MKLLIVEDHKRLAENIKQGLVQEGYAVDLLEDGLEAEKHILLNQNEYDLVLLDRLLPGKDGIAVCKTWRERGVTLPVLMLTALGSVEDKVSGLDSGADDYLAKPFAFEELLARINALLRRPKLAAADIIKVGDISINLTERSATIKNGATKDTKAAKEKPLPLTLKEFMILEYLARNPNMVISRDTLYAHAWDFADGSSSNTVDVHIKNLRKKLQKNGKKIHTIRGLGYKIEL
jgi:DNA-binding response OmpR family regulator